MATASGDVVRQCNDIFCYSAPTQAFVMDDSLDIKIQQQPTNIFNIFLFVRSTMAAIWRYEIFFREMRRFNISPAAAGLAPIVSKLNYFCWSTQWGNQLVPAMQSSRWSATVVLIPSQPSTGTCGADSQTTGFLYQLTNCKIMRVNTAGARLAGGWCGLNTVFSVLMTNNLTSADC